MTHALIAMSILALVLTAYVALWRRGHADKPDPDKKPWWHDWFKGV